jgi:hypothetical protein
MNLLMYVTHLLKSGAIGQLGAGVCHVTVLPGHIQENLRNPPALHI